MNPALLIKLRPTGPWRIGPDSGARNQVDAIYHSDTLYAAVTSAMLRLGLLPDWLRSTSGDSTPAVCFSSCFPFLAEIAFVVPPRTIWPPSSPALLSARVRWKSARFVPLGIVQGLLSGQPLDEEQWAVDGPSGCLVPAGRSGPFRPGLRFNAAVDRLTGAAERHSVACLEFRPGAGLWTVVRFADQAARDRWLDPIKTAFRLLSDSGFGGERSLGWGRAEMPECVEGTLPEMILAPKVGQAILSPASAEKSIVQDAGRSEQEPPPIPEPSRDREGALAAFIPEPDVGQALPPADAEQMGHALSPAKAEQTTGQEAGPTEQVLPAAACEPATGQEARATEPEVAPAEEPAPASDPAPLVPEPSRDREVGQAIPPAISSTEAPALDRAASTSPQPHWLLSLFTPASTDAIDWTRGNYTVMIRCGRVEAPSRSGDLKRHLQMVVEGSVLYAASTPRGSAPDVAPEGFAHPVFRAGFAVSIPLPEASGAGQTGSAPPAAKVT
jgi:CRISPR type III-A-associated RAMP protein Csm4